MKLVVILLVVVMGVCEACTSARSRIPTLSNDVDNFPAMFAFVADPADPAAGTPTAATANGGARGRLADKYCPRKPHLACSVVRVNWKALRSLKVKFPLRAADPTSYLVLKKVTEEGLDLVLAEMAGDKAKKARATANITYKVRLLYEL